MKQDSINISKVNTGLSRRNALATMFGGGAALLGLPALGQAQTPAKRPIKKLPPAKLGENQGAIKWTSKFSVSEFLNTATDHLHALGLAITTLHQGTMLQLNDLYLGDSPDGFEGLNTTGTYSNPVLLPDLKMIVVADTLNHLLTIQRNTDGSLNIQELSFPWQFASNFIAADGDTFAFVTPDNQLIGVTPSTDGSTITTSFSVQGNGGAVSNVTLKSIGANSFVYVNGDYLQGPVCNYMTRTTLINSFKPGFAIGPFSINGQYIYCLGDDGSLYHIEQFRLDTPPNYQGWKTYLNDNSTGFSNFEIANGAMYAGYGDGTIRSFNLDTGAMQTIPVGDGNAGELDKNKFFIEDGIAYVAIYNGKTFAIDLASNGINSISYDFQSLPNPTWAVGVENGIFVVLTALPGDEIVYAGVNLSAVLHGYSCDSVLMAEDYTAGGNSGYVPANPGYRTVVHLSDENNCPRVNTQVRIEATDTVTITTDDGTTTTLAAAGEFTWLTTDENGDLHFISQADDIQSPALYLWSAFMDTQESIIIYPDHVSLNKLTVSQANDYSTAKSFDGSDLVGSNIDHDQLAKTVSGILGGGSTIDPPAGPYSSYPATQTNMLYQAVKSTTNRVMTAGAAQSFVTTINSDGSITYGSATTFTSVQEKQLSGVLVLSWSDFKKDVIKAGKKIAKIAVNIGEAIEHEITAIDGAIYQFVVTAFEDVVGVITGFFKTIFADIKKAVEWLSALFDWDSIKQAHQQILTMIDNFRGQVRGYLNQDRVTLTNNLNNFFGNAEQSVSGFFNTLGSSMGSFQSQQKNGNDPKAAYGGNGSYAQSQSMHSKAKNNIKKTSKWSSPPTTTPLAMPSALSTIKDLVNNQIPNAIEPELEDIQKAFQDFRQQFREFASNPGAMLKHAIGDLFTIIGDLVVLFLKSANLVLDLLIDLIADLLDTAFNLVTGGIDIPILSDLFKLIFGRDIRFVDLVAWMIAVPVSIIQKISSASAGVGGENSFQLIAWAVATIFGGIIDALNDGLSPAGNDPIAILDLTCAIFAFGLGTPSSFPNDPTICYFAFGVIPIIINFSNIANAFISSADPGPEEEAEIQAYANFCCLMQGIYGILNLGVAVVNSQINPKQFSDPNGSVLAQNIFSNVGLISKMIYPDQPEVTVVTDVVCPVSSAICGIVANA